MNIKSLATNNCFLSYKKKLGGIARPLDNEINHQELPIKGNIPKSISGTFYRNGPNQKTQPFSHHHLIDGHGMLHKFDIHNSRIYYTNRWINTKIFNLENKYNTGLTGSLIKPFCSHNKIKLLSSRERTRANTNVFKLKNMLYTFEEGGIPYITNQENLTHFYIFKDALKLKTTVTGHPKYDHDEKKLYCINWNGEDKYAACTVFSIDENHKCSNLKTVDMPYRAFIHDFAITKNYIIIPLFPCLVDYNANKKNVAHNVFSWNPELAAEIIILKKRNFEIVTSFKIDLCYALHTCNAYEQGDHIYLDLIAHDSPILLYNEESYTGKEKIRSQLTRLDLNLNSKKSNIIFLDSSDFLYNFPRIDDRLTGKKHRYIYATMTRNPNRNHILYNEFLVAFDTLNLQKKVFLYGQDWFFNEPIFVANHHSNYILSIVSNYKLNQSKLLFFNENDISTGPIAEGVISHMIPYGFHGHWSSVEEK